MFYGKVGSFSNLLTNLIYITILSIQIMYGDFLPVFIDSVHVKKIGKLRLDIFHNFSLTSASH